MKKSKRPSAHVDVAPNFIAEAIRDALDPVKVPGKAKTWKDMTLEEKMKIAARYGIQPPDDKEA